MSDNFDYGPCRIPSSRRSPFEINETNHHYPRLMQLHPCDIYAFYGGAGSRKTTLADAAGQLIDAHVFDMGRHLAHMCEMGDPFAVSCKAARLDGKLVPDSAIAAWMRENHYMLTGGIPHDKPSINVGVPRTTNQAIVFLTILRQFHPGKRIGFVYLQTPQEACVNELQVRGREDDEDVAISNRWSEFEQNQEFVRLFAAFGGMFDVTAEFDGTHMRRMAPKFLRQMGFDIPVAKLEAYRATLPEAEREELLV